MNLKFFTDAMISHPAKALQVRLPSGEFLPDHFHVTELGVVTKNFTDCGGTYRSVRTCVFQTWVANDVDHRINSDKIVKIIESIDNVLLNVLDVYMEVQRETISLFKVECITFSENSLILELGNTYTNCLAPDKCGVTESCCAGGGCC